MTETPLVTLITYKKERIISWIKSLKQGNILHFAPQLLSNKVTLRKDLLGIIQECLGVIDGSINTNVVVIDSYFPLENGKYFIMQNLDPKISGNAGSAVSLLEGAGIPTLIHLNNVEQFQVWELAKAASGFASTENIVEDINNVLNSRKFNPRTLHVENEFAKNYDEKELEGAATVSAIIRENEYVLNLIEGHIKEGKNFVLLDMGCGTGRFEELLLKNSEISDRIKKIYAVDFAPRYLVEARTRLAHFLGKNEMDKILFYRKIAENTHFPNDYFDIIIASFGIVCFSRFHLILPEIRRILRPGGLVVFTGYNRNAMTYEFEKQMLKTLGQSASHFSIRIDREKNIMHLGDNTIDCFTFNLDDFIGIVKLMGLRPIRESGKTYPVLYGSARKEYLNKLSKESASKIISGNDADVHHQETCLKKGSCKEYLSYQTVNLLKDPMNSGFSEIIHRMDEDIAALLPDQGYYFLLGAQK